MTFISFPHFCCKNDSSNNFVTPPSNAKIIANPENVSQKSIITSNYKGTLHTKKFYYMLVVHLPH